MKQFVEILAGVLFATSLGILLLHRSRRPRPVATIIASMRHCSISASLGTYPSLSRWHEASVLIAAKKGHAAYVRDMFHNARCIVEIATASHLVADEDIRFMAERMWGICFCLLTALAEEGICLILWHTIPRLSSLWATSAYAEIWTRFKVIAYEQMPELVTPLERVG